MPFLSSSIVYIGEPMVNEAYNRYNNPIVRSNNWRLTNVLNSMDLHELGHMQAMPDFPGEGEASVHLPYTFCGLRTGRSLDQTFRESVGYRGDMKNAVIDWIITNEFASGYPMNIQNNPTNQVRYQARGHAHYVYIASVYGWETLMLYFRTHNLLYEAFKVHFGGEDNLSFEDQKKKYYETAWPWKQILGQIADAATLEEVDWDTVAGFFDGSWNNNPEYYMSNTGVNIVLFSLATRSNLLGLEEFWGVNGINEGTTKNDIQQLIGFLPDGDDNLCSLFELYESYLPQSQKDLTDHIVKIYPYNIESIENNIITWTPETFYLDNRYGAGWYTWNDIYNSTRMQSSLARINEGKLIACSSPPTAPTTPTAPTPAPTPAPIASPVTSPLTSPVASPVISTTSPVVSPVISTPSTSCVDSPLRFKVLKEGQMITRSCEWVATRSTNWRCSFGGVKLMCPSTCNNCSAATCVDATSRLQFEYNGRKVTRDCTWVKRKDTMNRCSVSGMEDSCRGTCGQNC